MDIWAYHQSCYMAEGANNVIFQVARAPWVLRFAKHDPDAKNYSSDLKKRVNTFDCVDCANYYQYVVTPTFRGEYLFPRFDVENSNMRLSEHVEKQYELNSRRKARHGSLISDKFIVIPDVTRLREAWDDDSYCLEIKPKCGYIPSAPDCVFHPLSAQYCRFCLQLVSGIKKTVYHVNPNNLFCPLDLFSTCLNRIRRAVAALFKTPQNNLKVFKNGIHEVVEGFGALEVELMQEALFQAILGDARENPRDFAFEAEDFCARLPKLKCCERDKCPRRFRGGILDAIQELQRTDKAGLYKVAEIWKTLSDDDRDDFTRRLKDFSSPLWTSVATAVQSETVETDPLCILRNFLYSMTFRDCGIAVIFSKQNEADREVTPQRVVINHKDQKYYFVVKSLDYDPRSPLNIPFYYHQSLEVYHRFLEEKALPECSKSCQNLLL